MPVRLNQPLSKAPNADEQAMLAMLQGNILKGHGRKKTVHVLLRFDPAQQTQARAFLRTLGAKLTSAKVQLGQAAQVRAARKAGKSDPATPPFWACMLSKDGYAALGLPKAETPGDVAFRDGMKARGRTLADPPSGRWEAPYRGEVHAMVLIGGVPNKSDPAKSKQADGALAELLAMIPAGAVQVLGIEHGRAYANGNGDGVEHFGYVDGRSQPLLLEQDVEAEAADGDGIVRWDPTFPLKQVLVNDPAVRDPNAFGSYFVYRKLEQNVSGFKAAVAALGRKLKQIAGQHGGAFDPEVAGAMIVGRFEDGTPLLLQNAEGMHNPVPNDFDYAGDMLASKCPFHAHIRKTNPRGDTTRLLGVPLDQERARIMARRGITYGDRKQNARKEFTDKPAKNVGLLFMAYQSDFADQFEFTQQAWANSAGFVQSNTGIDPVIGQGGNARHTHRVGWGNANAPMHQQTFAGFVTLKGGEYFFAPSLPFFAAL
jgi:Dyp-type peroxidase family